MNHQQIVLRELKRRTRKGITQNEMARYGIGRLSARIKDLRNSGILITTKPETYINRQGNQVRYGRYFLG